MSGQANRPPESIDVTLDQVLALIRSENVSNQRLTEKINRLRVSDEISTMAAEDFSLEDAIFAYDLNLTRRARLLESVKWPIQDIAGTQDFPLSQCLREFFKSPLRTIHYLKIVLVLVETLMANYSENFDRSSEAACRTALYCILNECLTVMVSIVVHGWRFHSAS